VICAVCGFNNIQGEDECANCGADLRTVDIPSPSTALEDRLIRDHLDRVHGRDPILVAPETPVRTALRQMQDQRTNAVLVGDTGGLQGIFTERDALLKVAGKPLDGLTLREVMTPDPVVLRPDDTIAVAIHKMAVGSFRHIPLVAQDGHVTGIVTAQDVMRHILALLG
jgi:CBS domain-containing protein